MNKLSILARGLVITALALGGLLAVPASAAEQADIDVDFSDSCTGVEATSSKDISNVVVEYADGTVEKFDGINRRDWDFSTSAGIAGIWVKSGSNASGDGPGYGERFDCAVQPAGSSTPAKDEPKKDEPKKAEPKKAEPKKAERKQDEPKPTEPKQTDAPAKSSGGDAVVGAECVAGGVRVTSTKDISNVVFRFTTGPDVKFDGLSGTERIIAIPEGRTIVTVFVKSGDNASGAGPGYGQPVTVTCEVQPNATAPTLNTPAATPAATATEVASTTGDKPNAPAPKLADLDEEVLGARLDSPANPAPAAAATKDTSVLGNVLTRAPQVASAALARTGSSPAALGTIALGLVLAGTLLVRRTRRNAVA